MIHSYTDDQAEVIEALKLGRYSEDRKTSDFINHYTTYSGVSFRWLHGFADGKSVKIFDEKQPEWFARRVRKALK